MYDDVCAAKVKHHFKAKTDVGHFWGNFSKNLAYFLYSTSSHTDCRAERCQNC